RNAHFTVALFPHLTVIQFPAVTCRKFALARERWRKSAEKSIVRLRNAVAVFAKLLQINIALIACDYGRRAMAERIATLRPAQRRRGRSGTRPRRQAPAYS